MIKHLLKDLPNKCYKLLSHIENTKESCVEEKHIPSDLLDYDAITVCKHHKLINENRLVISFLDSDCRIDSGTSYSITEKGKALMSERRLRGISVTPSEPSIKKKVQMASLIQESSSSFEEAKDGDKAEKVDLSSCFRNAYNLYNYALEKQPALKTDLAVYNWLKEKAELPGSTTSLLPGNFDTFRRYLSETRRILGESKHTKKHGRPLGGCVVKKDQV